jgi:hypothetical protein
MALTQVATGLLAGSITSDKITSVANTAISGRIATSQQPTGTVLQVVNIQSGVKASGTGLIPFDNTIPQNTEGNEFFTLSITPTSASSKLIIQVLLNLDMVATRYIVALFLDSGVNAIAVGGGMYLTANWGRQISLSHYMTAGTTSAMTFKVRAGGNDAGTTYLNSVASSDYFGGTFNSGVTIMEIAA